MDEDKKMRGFPRDKEESISSPEGQNTPDYAANNGAKQGEMPDGQNAEKQADAAAPARVGFCNYRLALSHAMSSARHATRSCGSL